MKKLFSLLVITCIITSVNAQVEKLLVGQNGTPSFIKFNTTNKAATTADSKTVLKNYVFTQQKDGAKEISSSVDKLGYVHEKFQQYHNGVKVEYGTYSANRRNGVIHSMNGEYLFIEDDFKTKTVLSEDVALRKALEFIGAQKYMWQNTENELFAKKTEKAGTYYPKAELVIVQNFYGKEKSTKFKPTLAYKFNIYAERPLSRDFVYVDAKTGEIVHKNPIIKHCNNLNHNHSALHLAKVRRGFSIMADANGTGATRYSGTRAIVADSYSGSYRLREAARGIETYDMNMGINYNSAVDFTDNDNNWTAAEHNNAQKDNAALDAHWGGEQVWEYWMTKHNRNSFDDNGAVIKNYVHFDLVEYGYPNQDNAFWNGSVMTYGDGTSFDALTCIDVVAHEIGHAVTENTSNLVYSYESGAMNEGFSDIWGACVEYFADPSKDTWLIGEEIGGPIRSMVNPNAHGQPDTYLGTNWYAGSGDNGGVHYNSGVLNHWFYILTVGKTGTNDNGDSFSVTGIGIDAAANITHRMGSVYLSANSQYSDARTFAIQSAEDLYGAGSNEVIQTTNAMYAVGIGAEYGQISYCTSKGNNSSYEWIAGVTIGSFTNNSGAAGYTNFTSQTIELNSGQSYGISLVPGFASTTYNEYWKIWIDLNADGDFSDANELVFDAGSMSQTTVTGNLIVPSVADVTTRLRVSMKYNGAQTECETFSYGEVEDYTVNITSGGGDTEAPTTPTNLSSSNITASSFDVSWTASTDNVGVTGYNVYLNGSLDGTTTSTNYSFSGLSASTTYAVAVEATDAASNVSGQVSINVTTSTGGLTCTNTVTSFPYNESFESGLGLWLQESSDDIDWTRDASGTPSSNTGPSSASDGTYYMYVEASSPNYPSKTAIFNGPCFDLSSETVANFSFDYHMYGTSMGTLELQAKTGSGSWTTIWTKSGNQNNAWFTTSIDLGSYLGEIVQLRFYGTTGSSYTSDMTIDKLTLSTDDTPPGCTDITLSITLDNYPEETSWIIKNAAGTTVASGGTYGSQPDGSTITQTICLEDGCYDFTINDTYGDGICCAYGSGSYSLMNGAVTLASGGSFASSETTNFCLSGGSVISSFTSQSFTKVKRQEFSNKDFRVYPNPVVNELHIMHGYKEADYLILTISGKLLYKGPIIQAGNFKINTSELNSGMYILKIESREGGRTTKFQVK